MTKPGPKPLELSEADRVRVRSALGYVTATGKKYQRARSQLRADIRRLLAAGNGQASIARAMGRSRSWLNDFLKG